MKMLNRPHSISSAGFYTRSTSLTLYFAYIYQRPGTRDRSVIVCIPETREKGGAINRCMYQRPGNTGTVHSLSVPETREKGGAINRCLYQRPGNTGTVHSLSVPETREKGERLISVCIRDQGTWRPFTIAGTRDLTKSPYLPISSFTVK
jgi:hypothetical protein